MKTIINSNEERDAFLKSFSEIDCTKRKFIAEFKVYRKPRTLPQNRLFHALLNCIIIDTEIGQGFTQEELKEYFLRRFAPTYIKEINGVEVMFRKRSSKMDSKEMTVLIEGVYRDGIEVFEAAYLPHPGDQLWEQFFARYGE